MEGFIGFILSLFGHKTASGSLFLVTGQQELEINTGFTPKEVWIRPTEHHHHVCLGSVDCFDIKVVPHGFILIANVTENSREIEWIAVK